MQNREALTDRQFRVLAAVIQIYVEPAQPAGSQSVAPRARLGISSASGRSTMSELEAMGYLFHAHTSGGRIPTDRGYRLYVNKLLPAKPVGESARARLESEIAPAARSAVEDILLRAAQGLGVLTQELGVAIAPALDGLVLERLELVRVSGERLLAVLTLPRGLGRTIFVELPAAVAPAAVDHISLILNERLAGLPLREIRLTLSERLRGAARPQDRAGRLQLFVAQGEELFDFSDLEGAVVLGSAQPLAEQPEFASNFRMRELLELTERRDVLRQAFEEHHRRGLRITIGSENSDPRLAEFTLVTSAYRRGSLSGVIGVLGPTRMPYDKIIGLVEHTSRMVEGLME